MNDFKIGQKVWSFNRGWGVVTDLDPGDDYSVQVLYGLPEDQDDCWYTATGAEFKGAPRALFFKEIPIPADALVPPIEEIELNTGDIVVFNNGALGYVELYSGKEVNVFSYHIKVPQSLDEAFGPIVTSKKNVKKVIGNIND